jgi:phosphoserine phosphatase RsbU/P
LNEYFQMSSNNDLYFTIWYGVYDQSAQKLTFSSAGHPAAILIQASASKSLKTSGLPIGMISEAIYQNDFCQIDSNSELYVFSDGVYEITQKNNKVRTFNDLVETLGCEVNKVKLKEFVEDTVALAKYGEQFEDDFSLLQVKFN